MKWLKQWKSKHWDKRVIKDPPKLEVGQGWYEHTPKLRKICERVWADIVEHRWLALSMVAVIVAALISR